MKNTIEIRNQVRINGKIELDNHIILPPAAPCGCKEAQSKDLPTVRADQQLALDLCCMCIQTYIDYDGKTVTPPKGWKFAARWSGPDRDLDDPTPDATVRKGILFQSESDPKTVVYAFRGTQTPTEVFQDMKFFKDPFEPYGSTPAPSGVEVHKGFLQTYKEIRQELFNLYHRYKPQHIILTGHSLGAALATLFHLDLALSDLRNVTHYNFASPRVGNAAFAQALEDLGQDILRFVNSEDWVPTLPGEFLGYRHAGSEISLCFTDDSYTGWHSNDNHHRAICNLYHHGGHNCNCSYQSAPNGLIIC